MSTAMTEAGTTEIPVDVERIERAVVALLSSWDAPQGLTIGAVTSSIPDTTGASVAAIAIAAGVPDVHGAPRRVHLMLVAGPGLAAALVAGTRDAMTRIEPALKAAAQAMGAQAVQVNGTSVEHADSLPGPLASIELCLADVVPVGALIVAVEEADAAPTARNSPDAAPATAPGTPVTSRTVHAADSSTRPARPAGVGSGLEMLRGVEMEVTVEIGRTRMTVRELLELSPGQVIELDRAAGSPADLFVNGTLLARGEIVVVDEDFGLRITEIVTAADLEG